MNKHCYALNIYINTYNAYNIIFYFIVYQQCLTSKQIYIYILYISRYLFQNTMFWKITKCSTCLEDNIYVSTKFILLGIGIFFFFDIYLQLRVVYTSDKQIKNNINTLLLFLFESVKRTPIFRFDESSAKEFSRNLQ